MLIYLQPLMKSFHSKITTNVKYRRSPQVTLCSPWNLFMCHFFIIKVNQIRKSKLIEENLTDEQSTTSIKVLKLFLVTCVYWVTPFSNVNCWFKQTNLKKIDCATSSYKQVSVIYFVNTLNVMWMRRITSVYGNVSMLWCWKCNKGRENVLTTREEAASITPLRASTYSDYWWTRQDNLRDFRWKVVANDKAYRNCLFLWPWISIARPS